MVSFVLLYLVVVTNFDCHFSDVLSGVFFFFFFFFSFIYYLKSFKWSLLVIIGNYVNFSLDNFVLTFVNFS